MTNLAQDAPAQPATPLPDYSSLLTDALAAPNYAQLQVAAYQAVNALYAATDTPSQVIAWLQQYAADKTTIDATLLRFLPFIVVDAALLPFAGELQQADLATLAGVLTKLLSNFVTAVARVKATP